MPAYREQISGARGGYRKPVSMPDFIIDWLSKVGKDNIASIRRNYYDALTEAGRLGGRFYQDDNGNWRGPPYKKPSYQSVKVQVENLIRSGQVQIVGSELSNDPHFDGGALGAGDPDRTWTDSAGTEYKTPYRNLYGLTGAGPSVIKTPKKPPVKPVGPPKETISITRQGNPRDIKPQRGKPSVTGELPLQGRRSRK